MAVALAEHARSEVKRATAELVGHLGESRTLTARFAVAAWSALSPLRFDALMAVLDDALENAGPVVVLVGAGQR